MSGLRIDPFTMVGGWQKFTTRARCYKQALNMSTRIGITIKPNIACTVNEIDRVITFYIMLGCKNKQDN